MVLFLLSILSFAWRTGSVSDPSDRPPLGVRAALGTRIAITSVLLLGLGYMAMIIKTLKAYGPHSGSIRTLANQGMERRNEMRGGTPTHGDITQGHAASTSEKEIRARDIDVAMERRGRQRERDTSTTHVRRREEVERRQHGGQSGVGDDGRKSGQDLKGMHGLDLVPGL